MLHELSGECEKNLGIQPISYHVNSDCPVESRYESRLAQARGGDANGNSSRDGTRVRDKIHIMEGVFPRVVNNIFLRAVCGYIKIIVLGAVGNGNSHPFTGSVCHIEAIGGIAGGLRPAYAIGGCSCVAQNKIAAPGSYTGILIALVSAFQNQLRGFGIGVVCAYEIAHLSALQGLLYRLCLIRPFIGRLFFGNSRLSGFLRMSILQLSYF